MSKRCVTCNAELDPERAELKDYCMAPACFAANYKPLRLVEIGQTKTNAEIEILDDRVQRDLAAGHYRRDPIVVSRQPTPSQERPAVTFKRAAPQRINAMRLQYVQALQSQGLSVDAILQRAAAQAPHLKLSRQEVVAYMTTRRGR